jgi:hypothetical protein
MKVTQATIKRLIETGAAEYVSNKENFFRDINSTILYYSVGANGVNGAALVLWDGKIQVVIGRTANLFKMIR